MSRERVKHCQPGRRRSVSLDHIARRPDGRFGAGRISRGPRPDSQIGSGLRGRDRELAEEDPEVDLDEPIEPLAGDRQRCSWVVIPQGDLGCRIYRAR